LSRSSFRYAVRVESAAQPEIRLVSATFRPFEIGLRRDTRTLGVAVKGLMLRGRGATTWIEHASPLLADGWNGSEANFRWTGGAAALPLLGLPPGGFTLEVDVAMTREYRQALEPEAPRLRLVAGE
jgi:hypothetical protein